MTETASLLSGDAESPAIPSPEALPEGRIEAGSYRLRFARTAADIDRLLALRFKVFNLELGEGLDDSFATGRDTDDFDSSCHHMLVERTDGTMIGTYRMQTAAMAARGIGFYSATEYDLDALPGGVLDQSVEIGRACIHRRHRKRTVLFLLWQGLARYIVHNRLRYLFGCCSLTSQDQAAGIRLYRQLVGAGKVRPDLDVPVLEHARCEAPSEIVEEGPKVEIPPLFATYLRYGALVCSRPAIDRDFKTIDYLVLMDTATLSRRIRLIFGLGEVPPPASATPAAT
ncbi:MAG: GNAT family N-acetyltransferase [Acidobacteria bacterium]|nr:GNAT family N-acetyltransferase [Acidobacteriota bacterium]MCY3965158.1 GNAT family N-acetyltransferase [Acidobacteriota bacterium]